MLALVSTSQAKLEALAGDLGLSEERWLAYAADLRDPAAVQATVQAVIGRFGHVHILVPLVGGWAGGKELTATDPADLQAMLEQHVWTTWHLVQAFVPPLAGDHDRNALPMLAGGGDGQRRAPGADR